MASHSKLGPAGRFPEVRHHRHGRAAQYRWAQDETGDAGLDRLRTPRGDDRIRRDDEQSRRAAVDGARHRRVGGPTQALLRIDRQLDLDDDHPDGGTAAEQEDDDVGTVFGGLDLGQVGRGDTGLGVSWKRDAEHLEPFRLAPEDT
jgi:hypothetical protein